MENNLSLSQIAIVYAVMKIPYVINVFVGKFGDRYSKKLLIFNPYGEIIVSEEGSVYQINEAGKCLSFQREATEKMGVYSFKGNILIPFNYDLIFIKFSEKPRFEVKKNYYDGGWEVYNVDN